MLRKMNQREALALMGFPQDFKHKLTEPQLIARLGNSMSVNVLCFLFEIFFESVDVCNSHQLTADFVPQFNGDFGSI